ncbi:MAG: contractile injection system tape measure protein [Pseudobacter sp.]|uniref:contractile injection system tape measure protein n=1 Tax=Pseudobacter sp. TaxID=2045420 RepID=UPI003F7D7915
MIRKQVLDVSIHRSLDAFQAQHALSDWYWKQLLPLMEKAFDELVPEGETVRIDSLQIDLGHLSPKLFKDQHWLTGFQQALTQQLRKAINEQLSVKTNAQKYSPVLQAARQWLYYMENGVLPWNINTIPEGWLDTVLQALATDITSIDQLRSLIKNQQPVLLRIIRQHDHEFITALIKVLTAKHQENLSSLIKELEILHSGISNKPESISITVFRERCIALILTEATNAQHRFDLEKVLQQIIAVLNPGQFITKNSTPIGEKLTILKPVWNNYIEEKTKKASSDPVTKKEEEDNLFTISNEPALQNTGESIIDNEGLYVDMAGLVLLHPFLAMLFSQLDWTTQNQFKNKDCQQRAIGMLHYLVTGKTIAPEYELGMAKLICGYPLQEPVPAEFDFTKEELEEADHLLTVVISRWEVLKRTSIEGLREAFLQRKGKLTQEESGILLQVEQGSIDMLLDQLPWTISMIKLPWMQNLLRVDWR